MGDINEVLFGLAQQGRALNGRLDDVDERKDAGLFTAERTVVFADSPYTLTAHDGTVFVDTSGGAVTVVLPTAVGIGGRVYKVKDNGSGSSNTITISTNGSETIDTAGSYSITDNLCGVSIQSDGANWYIVSSTCECCSSGGGE